MVMGFFQLLTLGFTEGVRIGVRNTVPSRMALMVPFGLFHFFFRLYSFILSSLGVMVAHFTPTPSLLMASALSTVTLSSVSSLLGRERS